MAQRKHDLQAVLTAIKGSGGVKMTIAKKLGVSRPTLDAYLDYWKTAADAFQEEKSNIDDAALSVVIEDIVIKREVTTAKWWLAKKLPQEFGDAIDITSGGKPLQPVEYIEIIRPDEASD